jgi:type II secretory pathway component GspD/PulD (secretin)
MFPMIRCVALACLVLMAERAWSQNAQPQPDPPPAREPAPPPAAAPQLVSVEIELIELAALETPLDVDPAKADAELLARVRELARTGALRMSSKMRVTAVDGKPAMVQFGEQALLANASRVIRGGDPVRAAGPVSLSRTTLGTLMSATPTIQPSGNIVVEFQIEKSYLSQPQHKMADAEDVDAELPAARPQQFTTKSIVSVPDGKTTIIGGTSSKSSDGESSQVLVLMTVRAVK